MIDYAKPSMELQVAWMQFLFDTNTDQHRVSLDCFAAGYNAAQVSKPQPTLPTNKV